MYMITQHICTMYPRRIIERKRIVIIQVHLYRMYTVNKVTVSGMVDSYCDLFITWPPSAENIKCLHGIQWYLCLGFFPANRLSHLFLYRITFAMSFVFVKCTYFFSNLTHFLPRELHATFSIQIIWYSCY